VVELVDTTDLKSVA